MKKKYNILWLDDDFNRSSQNFEYLESSRNKIIKNCENCDLNIASSSYVEEFNIMLSSHDYDAVILDVRGQIKASDDRTSKASAFFKAADALKQCNYNGIKLILSGQPYVIDGEDETFRESLDTYGFSEKDIHSKIELKDPGAFGDLLIKKIEDANSLEFQIRNKYPKAYEAAKKLGKWYFFCHLFEDNHDLATIVNNIQEMRDVIEKMKDSLCEKNIIPPLLNLNSIYSFYNGEITEGYKIKDTEKNKWFHPVLVYELEVLLSVTQDSKHSKDNLKLHVREYLEKSHDENVLQVMTHILVSLLNAYNDIINKINDLSITKGITWEEHFEENHVKVKSDPKCPNFYYVEYKPKDQNKTIKCLLGLKDNKHHCDCLGNVIVPGDEINIISKPGPDKKNNYDAFIECKNIIKCQ